MGTEGRPLRKRRKVHVRLGTSQGSHDKFDGCFWKSDPFVNTSNSLKAAFKTSKRTANADLCITKSRLLTSCSDL